ncbi:hypothetical protein M5K25_010093 [Dendrobium thyrsiflorum]|uniref:Uncharacterized protein n=1 Tax=Dendrobium thyrsiflorum TaxID=117978 RepID=A0ABD0V5T5_DENTH
MVWGVMMNPIKIPWFCHPGPSWSLVYLVRGGSQPNLTEGSLSAAMGCFVQGYLVDLGWMLVIYFNFKYIFFLFFFIFFQYIVSIMNDISSVVDQFRLLSLKLIASDSSLANFDALNSLTKRLLNNLRLNDKTRCLLDGRYRDHVKKQKSKIFYKKLPDSNYDC